MQLQKQNKNKYKCKQSQKLRQKCYAKVDIKMRFTGTEITVSIESKEQVEVKAALNMYIELKFNSDIQTAKSVPTFHTRIFQEKSNY